MTSPGFEAILTALRAAGRPRSPGELADDMSGGGVIRGWSERGIEQGLRVLAGAGRVRWDIEEDGQIRYQATG